uniref:SERPIN domain-containing protein n=1 Tax=Rhabditophanes sp. KR3021 TaxID=114890 RepID=A0AC35UDE1_9BILA
MGSNGNTLKQLAHFLNPKQTSMPEAINLDLITTGEYFQSEMNLFMPLNTEICPDYYNHLPESLNIKIQKMDFSNNVKAVDIINHKIQNLTNGHISHFLSPQEINEFTQLIIAESFYFKFNWTYPFKKESMGMNNFVTLKNEFKTVQMMSLSRKLNYTQDDKFHMVKLMFADQASSMIILVPKEKGDIKKLFSKLNTEQIIKMIPTMKEEQIKLTMPSFKTEVKHDLSKLMSLYGIVDAFTNAADFSKMSPSKLKISKFSQTIGIDFGIENIQNYDAINIDMSKTRQARSINEPIVVTADRPFLYFVHMIYDIIPIVGIYH